MDVALRVAYDGTLFRGLARQPEGGTVENALIDALRHEGFVEGSLRCGSRTDAGVSAAENVLKCQLDRPHLKGLVPALSAHLPAGVWVTAACEVPADWQVRHAVKRVYRYLAGKTAEDIGRMQAACAAFEGKHDFSAFARLEERTPLRSVRKFTVTDTGDFWQFEITARGYLWNQVRRMVDACMVVGLGEAETADIANSLATKEADPRFGLALPEGLMLQSVTYDPPLAWAEEARSLHPGKVASLRQAAEIRKRVVDGLSASS